MCYFSRPSMVMWEIMNKKWTEYSSHSDYVRSFFNTFISQHPGFQFTVAQKFDALYEIGVTWAQYDQIKMELESGRRGLHLADINVMEYLANSDRTTRSFSSLSEYRAYRNSTLRPRNQAIVRSKLQEVKQHCQKARSHYDRSGEKLILTFDIEAYEYNHDKMLEIGYIVASVDGSGSPRLTEKRHFIIQENLHHKNGDHCTDNRNGFRFGQSQTVPLQEAIASFREAVTRCTFLVAHSAHSDEDYLRKIGVDIAELGKEIMDTQLVEMQLEMTRPGYRSANDRLFFRGLTRLLENYNVSFTQQDLHNAGCDAYYTMKVFLRQMGCSGSVVNALT